MNQDLRRRLAAVVGNTGVGADAVVHPSDVAQLREVLAASASAGAIVSPAGSVTAGRADVIVAADRLDAIRLDDTAMLLHAGAAALWATVRESAATKRLVVAGLPRVRSDRAGESVARGEIARRALAGVAILTTAGELITAGGRTLKDVVGYDLAGLVLGSGDRLGLIVSVTLRLEPAGARIPTEAGTGPWRGNAGIDLIEAFAG